MSLPLWSKHDAEMYRSLSLFPTELEKEFLTPDEFRSNFRDLNGRPVQDILEALSLYSRQGYFSYEIMLMPAYLKHGQALAQVTAALNKLRPKPSAIPNERNGLSRQVYAKVLAERSLTRTEASRLPDEAKPYLVFRLTDIGRDRLREELAIYNDNAFIQPSRLAKVTHKEPDEYTARVLMDDSEQRVVCITVTARGDYPISKLQVNRAPYDFMHYLFRPENSDREVTIREVQKNVASCRTRNSLTALVDDCGFNKALKGIFFIPISNDKVHFSPKKKINRKQLDVVQKLSAKYGNKQ